MTFSTSKIFFVLLILIMALGRTADAVVWTDTNKWNQQWEDKYSQWIANGLSSDIFVNGKYQNIFTDCADAAYIVRAIFAYENKLPFVMMDPSGSGSKITNRMKRFDDTISELGRFHDFANFISAVGDTKSLAINDTYPVAISRENIKPGTLWSRPLVTKANAMAIVTGDPVQELIGHVEIVKSVGADGNVEVVGSRLPGAVRSLIWTPFLVFMPVDKTTGFRRWKQPEWYGKDKTTLPGYSLEQFKMGETAEAGRSHSTWSSEVKNRLRQ